MKVSEAMRAGWNVIQSQHLRQITVDYYRPDEGACAAGCAFLGAGVHPVTLEACSFNEVEALPAIGDRVPWALLPPEYRMRYPEPKDTALIELIPRLNDVLRWSVEEIADWLKGIGR